VVVAGGPLRPPHDYNNILAILPADWPVTLKLIRDGQSVEVAARLERLPLGVPLVYVPDLEHNHRELLNLLDRSAKRTGTSLRRPFSRVVFRGRVRTGQGGEVRTVVLTVASRVDSAATAEPLPSEEPVDASLADEWQELASPLLARPEVDLRWELLAGDEVEGRIVSVVERRIEADRRIRWKLDFQTDELRQVTIGTQERPAEVAWQPGNLAEFGDLHWPGVWTRRGHAGDGLLLEIDSIEPAYVSEETSAGSPQ
jgi:hypothetical protein